MKKIITVFLLSILIGIFTVTCSGLNFSVSDEKEFSDNPYDDIATVDVSVPVDAQLMTYAKSVVLLEKSTGKVLYSENENEKLYPASVTKIMTILLVCEAIDSGKIKLSDSVQCSKNAASKGGSQIWLETGETMTVDELLKATCVYSANDACTLLGEYVAGSESAFNELMNSRAAELGMANTHFDNCTGLDDTTETHLTTAYDVALMSRELLKHDFIKEYTTIWMDSLRNGETQLVNTNKLIRTYDGITGLKTGTTEKAGCCVAATAKRNNMELIAVVMGSTNSNDRFESAENLLDWGFSNYELYQPSFDDSIQVNIKVLFGKTDFVGIKCPLMAPILINKDVSENITVDVEIADSVTAPVENNQIVGKIVIRNNDSVLTEYDITVSESVQKLTIFDAFYKLLTSFSDNV
ncbi:MAG: D-alanyl-D-alanine carboxypeptidase [Clostridia bacterium]|nr:D-alanyl-D-alanine carboxypeptidase [Clostridia bacterium]